MSYLVGHRYYRATRGFTLVELLVVIGIIALLISILLPSLNKARKSAERIKCASNMRQIVNATRMFAADHLDYMPARAGTGAYTYSDSGQGLVPGVGGSDDNLEKNSSDWIAWRRAVDPITGEIPANIRDQNITYSALAKYLGVNRVEHTTPQEANRISEKLEEVFRCPADDLGARPSSTDRGAYRYSYSMNILWTTPIWGVFGYAPNERFGGATFKGKLSSIKNASEMLLLVCEDEQSIDDGVFSPNPSKWYNGFVNAVAARHETQFKRTSTSSSTTPNLNARGNVAFVDGHVEFMSRMDALRSKHTGRPDPQNDNLPD